jgi:hypothetical protein
MTGTIKFIEWVKSSARASGKQTSIIASPIISGELGSEPLKHRAAIVLTNSSIKLPLPEFIVAA